MLDGPLGFPVRDLGVLLRVEPKRGSSLGVLENLIPHLRLVGLPKRAVVSTDKDWSSDRLRLGDVGFRAGGHV